MARSVSASRQLARNFTSSLSFNGSSSKVAITSASAVNGLTACTIFGWFLPLGGGGANVGRIFHKGPNAVGYLDVLFPNTGRLAFNADWATDQTTEIATGLATGRWYHLILTYSGVVGEAPVIYINNVSQTLNTTSTSVGARASDSTALALGNRTTDTARAFNGLLTEMGICNRIITADERDALFYRSTMPSGVVGLWRLNEGSGTSATDGSGNGSTGTISNASYSTNVPMTTRSLAGARTLAGSRTLAV